MSECFYCLKGMKNTKYYGIIYKENEYFKTHWKCVKRNKCIDAIGILKAKEWKTWEELSDAQRRTAKMLKTKINNGNLKKEYNGCSSGMAASAYGY